MLCLLKHRGGDDTIKIAQEKDFLKGGNYDGYQRSVYHVLRAERIVVRHPGVRNVLVAGCGLGYTVDELNAHGLNAWGFDASKVMVEACKRTVPQHVAEKIFVADALTVKPSEVKSLTEIGRWDLVITEDMLECCRDDKEVLKIIRNLEQFGPLLHVIVPFNNQTTDFLWKSHVEWGQLVGPHMCTLTHQMDCRETHGGES